MCGMEANNKRKKMDECKEVRCQFRRQACETPSGCVTLCSRPFVPSSLTFYVASISSRANCTSHVYCKLEVYVCVYICAQASNFVICITVSICVKVYMCMYVCVSVCAVQAHSSATKCCRVAALLLLP